VRLDLNSRIAAKIEEAELDPDQTALLDKLLGKDYEVITADERLDKIAADFVEHCATRWEAGKPLVVCIDKITRARMHQRIMPLWRAKAAEVLAAAEAKRVAAEAVTDEDISARSSSSWTLTARWWFLDVDCEVLGDLSPLAGITGDVGFYVRTKVRRSGGMRFGARSGTVVVRPIHRQHAAMWRRGRMQVEMPRGAM
jgi:hypothetical protein